MNSDKIKKIIDTNDVVQIKHGLYSVRFMYIGKLCSAYTALDNWRKENAHVPLQLLPFDGADDNENGYYYLYIKLGA